MDVSSMLSNGGMDDAGPADNRRQGHQYPTRHGSLGTDGQYNANTYTGNAQRSLRGNNGITTIHGSARGSPAKKNQKHVVFQLIDPKDPRIQARLPMRVMISPHDSNESIVNTVKNFYGLYELGVSFEDKDGITLIADFKNFDNDMTVYVRTTVEQAPTPLANHARDSASPKKLALGAPFEMRPPSHSATHSPTRAGVRSLGARSMSPQSDVGRRSASVAPGGKPRNYRTKSKDNSVAGDAEGYSSGDNDNGSVASSRRSKVDDIKAEITVDNIVEGGRRKRAFESSELPLFVPPQVPMSASISSISPQRRSGPSYGASPYPSNQQTFSYTQPFPSPQSYGAGSMQPPFPGNPYQNGFQPPSRQLRGSRMSGASYGSNRHSSGGILPTPDPTVGTCSVISDEDVALQLMRLGDPTAFSHGRTSTSTVDDALSGKAEAASSDEGSDEEDDDDDDESRPPVPRFSKEDVGPQRKKQRLMNELPSDGTSGEEYEDHRDGTFGSEEANGENGQRKLAKPKSKARNSTGPTGSKPGKPRTLSMSGKAQKTSLGSKMPMSPASLPSQSRKASISSSVNPHIAFGDDEDDLSSKPRCQRCRKSKKGCDRQRPCGRCKDAGIGADGCISEDEGNGRKGRYGRHMGVPIKNSKAEDGLGDDSPPAQQTSAPANGYFLAPALPDKIKQNNNNNNNKRKR